MQWFLRNPLTASALYGGRSFSEILCFRDGVLVPKRGRSFRGDEVFSYLDNTLVGFQTTLPIPPLPPPTLVLYVFGKIFRQEHGVVQLRLGGIEVVRPGPQAGGRTSRCGCHRLPLTTVVLLAAAGKTLNTQHAVKRVAGPYSRRDYAEPLLLIAEYETVF